MSEVENEMIEVVNYVDYVRLYGWKAEKYFLISGFRILKSEWHWLHNQRHSITSSDWSAAAARTQESDIWT